MAINHSGNYSPIYPQAYSSYSTSVQLGTGWLMYGSSGQFKGSKVGVLLAPKVYCEPLQYHHSGYETTTEISMKFSFGKYVVGDSFEEIIMGLDKLPWQS